jgi:hypothetical protein
MASTAIAFVGGRVRAVVGVREGWWFSATRWRWR